MRLKRTTTRTWDGVRTSNIIILGEESLDDYYSHVCAILRKNPSGSELRITTATRVDVYTIEPEPSAEEKLERIHRQWDISKESHRHQATDLGDLLDTIFGEGY